jgi:hypothetical protein
VYEDGCEIELLQIIGNAYNKSLNTKEGAVREHCKNNPSMFLLGVV